MAKKTLISFFLSSQILFHIPYALAQETQNKVIINNEASIKAPALVPSDAKKLREERRRQEITTEDAIVRKLEKQRLLEEQKRLDKLFGDSQKTDVSTQQALAQASAPKKIWFFGNKASFALGTGLVTYPGAANVNSTQFPPLFASFGGYNHKENLALDVIFYYSRHYIEDYGSHRTDQPGIIFSVKFPFGTGKMKPYVGGSASLVYRKWSLVDRYSGDPAPTHPHEGISTKTWAAAFDMGGGVGADLAVADYVGLNADLRYHVNVYSEHKDSVKKLLKKRDSLILSINLKYYFF